MSEEKFLRRAFDVAREIAREGRQGAQAGPEGAGEDSGRPESLLNVPRYEILSPLGAGGMARVYRARDRRLGRLVALKIMQSQARAATQGSERFMREAQAAAKLSHPNVVTVYDAGEQEEWLYLVLELVEGQSLAEILNEEKSDLRRLLEILQKAARGVAAAHKAGIVHRDLKPANILVTSTDETKVTDFGLAHLMQSTLVLTQQGQALGTPVYMAPEQVRGQVDKITPRTDVYALGAILYQILTGQLLHTGSTTLEVFANILAGNVVPPRARNERVPRQLEAICLQALEKDPATRYPTAEEFADDLGRYLRGEPVQTRPRGTTSRAISWVQSHRAAVITATVLAFCVCLVPLLYQRAERAAPSSPYEPTRGAASRVRGSDGSDSAEIASRAAISDSASGKSPPEDVQGPPRVQSNQEPNTEQVVTREPEHSGSRETLQGRPTTLTAGSTEYPEHPDGELSVSDSRHAPHDGSSSGESARASESIATAASSEAGKPPASVEPPQPPKEGTRTLVLETFKHPQTGFQMDYPQGWEEQRPAIPADPWQHVTTRAGALPGGGGVGFEIRARLWEQFSGLEGLSTVAPAELSSLVSLTQRTTIRSGDREAIRWQAQAGNGALRGHLVLFLHEIWGIAITLVVQAERLEEAEPLFDKMLKTVRFEVPEIFDYPLATFQDIASGGRLTIPKSWSRTSLPPPPRMSLKGAFEGKLPGVSWCRFCFSRTKSALPDKDAGLQAFSARVWKQITDEDRRQSLKLKSSLAVEIDDVPMVLGVITLRGSPEVTGFWLIFVRGKYGYLVQLESREEEWEAAFPHVLRMLKSIEFAD